MWLALVLGACAGTGEEKNAQADVAAVAERGAEPANQQGESAPAPSNAALSARTLDEVQKAFDARKESFRRINSARLSQNAGTFNVTVTFAPSGEVVECRMLSTDFRDDPAFNAAVMAEVWRLRIPPRPGGGEFTVSSYPIAFSARSEAAAPQSLAPIEAAPSP